VAILKIRIKRAQRSGRATSFLPAPFGVENRGISAPLLDMRQPCLERGHAGIF